MPVVIRELRKVGILDRLEAIGIFNTRGITWRKYSGEELAVLLPTDPALTLGQDRFATAVLETLREECPTVTVVFGQRCVGIEQGDGHVRVMTTGDEGIEPGFDFSMFGLMANRSFEKRTISSAPDSSWVATGQTRPFDV